MKPSPVSKALSVTVLCCGALSACDRNPDPTPAAPVVPDQASTSSATSSVIDPLAGLVKAVASDGRQQAIDLRFELTSRPQPGQTVDIKLTLRGVDDATDAKLLITANPKLPIIAGNEASFAAIKAGEVVSHTVIVRGTEPGIFVVDAKLTAMANGAVRTMNYALPVAIVPPATTEAAAPVAAPK